MAIIEKYCLPGGSGIRDGTSWHNAWDLDEAAANISAGQRLNIVGDFSGYGKDIAFVNNATAESPIIIRGGEYDPSTFDPSVETFGVGFAYIDMGAFTLRFDGNAIKVEGLDVTSSDTYATVYSLGDKNLIYRCRIENTLFANNFCYALSMYYGDVVRCYCKSIGASSNTAAINGVNSNICGCYAKSAKNAIVAYVYAEATSVCNCILVGEGTAGDAGVRIDALQSSTESMSFCNNTIYNFDYGFECGPTPDIGDQGGFLISGNLAHTLIRSGCNHAGEESTTVNCLGNASYNTVDDSSFFGPEYGDMRTVEIGHIELLADPCTNAAGGDFSLNNAVGGGALLRAGAIINDLINPPFNLSENNYLDVGGVQHEDA